MRVNGIPKGTILIICAGVLWGSMGIFVKEFTGFGFTSPQIAAIRFVITALLLVALLAIRDPKGFKIKLKDIPLFLGLGLCSILFFTVCYFYAVQMMSMSVAAVLLYTSPIWVMLASIFLFKQKMTIVKGVALALAFAGCVLVSGIGGEITPLGIVFGICAGIGYGLYSILGTIAMRTYQPLTVTTYTFCIAAVGALVICDPASLVSTISATCNSAAGGIGALPFAGWVIAMAVASAFGPYVLYTYGLQTTEASKAAILATSEPMMATIFGVLVYHEALSVAHLAGIVCILAAIVILNLKPKTSPAS